MIVLLLILFASPVFAGQITTDEVKAYLSKTVQLHDPGDKSIGSDPFDYPAVDILPLWKKLGVDNEIFEKDNVVFDCKVKETKCYVPSPEVESFKRGKIEVLQLTKSIPWDFQYFVFVDGAFVDQLNFNMQKYDAPKVEFLDDDLLSITVLSSSGTSIISYSTGLYEISQNKVKEVLRYEAEQERSSWGMLFDERFKCKTTYSNGVLRLDYNFIVTMTDDDYESKVKGTLSSDPVVQSSKTIVLNRTSDGFRIDKSNSNFTLDDVASLDWGGYDDYYQAFKSEFDALESKDEKSMEWIKNFKAELRSGSNELKELSNYRGKMGDDIGIGMTLVIQGNNVLGVYFYDRWLQDIKIDGKIDGRTITLNEYDEKGNIRAKFNGQFLGRAPEYGDQPIDREVIEGEWANLNGKEKYKFRLTHDNSTYGQIGSRYGVAGFGNDKKVESFAQKFKKAVLKGDKVTASSMIAYPIWVSLDGKRTKIKDRAKFEQKFGRIFNETFLSKVKFSVPHNMFAKSSGVMLGDSGEIWIGLSDDKMRIVAINND